ncbi:MAG: ABC transporter ATP-binding protein [Alphaproteobacteria bacterium]
MPESAIRVTRLTKRYKTVLAVAAIDFAVPRGSATALLGGNGAGKTTTLSMIMGLVLPTSGTIEVLGQDMVRHRYRVLPRMNFSSPYVELPRSLTVRENLDVFARLYGIPDRAATCARLAEELDLVRFLKRTTGSLSAGEKTRVMLAKSLLNQPDLLLLDEPTASLDPDSADWIRTYLQDYQRRNGATVLMASHNMLEVERMCGDVMVMREGKIERRGTPAELIRQFGRDTLEEVYLDIHRREGAARAAQ